MTSHLADELDDWTYVCTVHGVIEGTFTTDNYDGDTDSASLSGNAIGLAGA